MFHRIVKCSKNHSFFLFGARGTGKTTYLKSVFGSNAYWIDLLNPADEEVFAYRPQELNERLESLKRDRPHVRWVVIDEIQKNPRLLDVVHQQIEKKHFLFALTGSSSRKLKRGQANMLAGRAFLYELFPLTYIELKDDFDLTTILRWGSLPSIFELDDDERVNYLRSYAQIYLKEEIVAEQLVRRLQPFRNFLDVAAQLNGHILNYSKFARDVHTEVPTIQSYFEILCDTQMGFLLDSFEPSIRKRQRKNPKFYFFDLGVKRALEKTLELPIEPKTFGYGQSFEHFIIAEAHRLSAYKQNDWKFSYLRTKDGSEIDLIIERPGLKKVLIEIKSTAKIKDLSDEKLVGFKKLAKDIPNSDAYVFSQDATAKRVDDICFLPWQKGFVDIGLL